MQKTALISEARHRRGDKEGDKSSKGEERAKNQSEFSIGSAHLKTGRIPTSLTPAGRRQYSPHCWPGCGASCAISEHWLARYLYPSSTQALNPGNALYEVRLPEFHYSSWMKLPYSPADSAGRLYRLSISSILATFGAEPP